MQSSYCYIADTNSFANCYYKQIELLFQAGTATREIPISLTNATSFVPTEILNVSAYVQNKLESLFKVRQYPWY